MPGTYTYDLYYTAVKHLCRCKTREITVMNLDAIVTMGDPQLLSKHAAGGLSGTVPQAVLMPYSQETANK